MHAIYSIPGKWISSLVLYDDFCAREDCEEIEQRLGRLEEDCGGSELMPGQEVAQQEIDPSLGHVEEDCEATEVSLGGKVDPRLWCVEDCEVAEAIPGLQEVVWLTVAAEQSLEEGVDAWVDN